MTYLGFFLIFLIFLGYTVCEFFQIVSNLQNISGIFSEKNPFISGSLVKPVLFKGQLYTVHIVGGSSLSYFLLMQVFFPVNNLAQV